MFTSRDQSQQWRSTGRRCHVSLNSTSVHGACAILRSEQPCLHHHTNNITSSFFSPPPSLPRSPLPPLPALTFQKSAPPFVERELCGHRAAGIRFQSSVNRNCSTDKHTTSVIGLQQVIDRRQGGENGGIRYVVSGCRGPTVCVLHLVKVG